MITRSFFGKTPEGVSVDLFQLTNSSGAELNVITYGAIIQSLKVRDRTGTPVNVVLGFETFSEYLADEHYIGAVVGRFANRIANGSFSIDGKLFQLTQNDNGNHLHGGRIGFSKAIWNAEVLSENAIKLSHNSPDGEEGYPGNLAVDVIYTLTDNNEVSVEYDARTDKPTIVNLVQHSYFNLSGPDQTILDHELIINTHQYLEVSNRLIPTGQLCTVAGTPFDFTHARNIGKSIRDLQQQSKSKTAYDNSWVLPKSTALTLAAVLVEKSKGLRLEVFTDKPGLHVYTGNFINNKFPLYPGICLETQFFPDSPNHAHFPSPILHPDEHYRSTTTFKFLTE